MTLCLQNHLACRQQHKHEKRREKVCNQLKISNLSTIINKAIRLHKTIRLTTIYFPISFLLQMHQGGL